jgi:hypothetical protein
MSSTAMGIPTHYWVLKEHAKVFFQGKNKRSERVFLETAGLEGLGRSGYGTFPGVLFENCTVDASIFVSKCLRAYGGCLGTRSR